MPSTKKFFKGLWKSIKQIVKETLHPVETNAASNTQNTEIAPITPTAPSTEESSSNASSSTQETFSFTPPSWDKCTKSSNWHGTHANQRMMNILSPRMSDSTFKDRLNFIKSRGCNTAHVILCNKGDGESAGYSIYGQNFDWTIDKSYANKMLERLKILAKENLGIVLWLATDDCGDWNSKIISNPSKYVADLYSLGFLKYASTVVLGLEVDEYWKNSSYIHSFYKAVKAKYNGKVGVHQTSGKYNYMSLVDIAFVQVNPGTSKDHIKSFIKTVKSKTGKPVNMFEMERQEDRSRSEAALSAGAFAVGNW